MPIGSFRIFTVFPAGVICVCIGLRMAGMWAIGFLQCASLPDGRQGLVQWTVGHALFRLNRNRAFFIDFFYINYINLRIMVKIQVLSYRIALVYVKVLIFC